MLAIEYTIKEFFNQQITVQWEWLLAMMIIITNTLFISKTEKRGKRTLLRPAGFGGQAED
jgi:hypothetical protein